MATLIGWLAGCGDRLDDGTPNASGSVQAFVPGTTVQASVFGDSAESAPLSQPIPLDAAGKATVYANAPVDLQFNDSSGASLHSFVTANGLNARAIEVENAGFSGLSNTGTVVAGGKTSLDAILSSLAASTGGADGLYQESAGATGIALSTALRDIAISVRSFQAKGDGSADDTSAIQTTINEVKRLGGGVVYFPPGNYLISSPLTLTSGAGVLFVGAGQSSSMIKQINATAAGIAMTGCSGCGVRSLGLTHSSVSTAAAILVGNASSTISLADVGVTPGKFRYGLSIDQTSPVSIRDCNIAGAGAAVDAASRAILLTNSTAVNISGGTYVNVAGTVFDFQALTSYSVSGAFFTGAVGVALNGCNKGTVVACPSLRDLTTPFSVTGADTSFAQFGNSVDGQTFDLTSGATFTPNQYLGRDIRLHGISTGVAYAIRVPTIAPTARGYRLTFHLFNNVGAPITGWAFDPGYHRSATAISLVDGHHTMIVFEYDIDASVWREVSISDTT